MHNITTQPVLSIRLLKEYKIDEFYGVLKDTGRCRNIFYNNSFLRRTYKESLSHLDAYNQQAGNDKLLKNFRHIRQPRTVKDESS